MRKIIKIDLLSDIKEFQGVVITMSQYPITIKRGTFTCDANSLLGIFAIDTSIPFEVDYHENEVPEVIDTISKFECTPSEINEYMNKYYGVK